MAPVTSLKLKSIGLWTDRLQPKKLVETLGLLAGMACIVSPAVALLIGAFDASLTAREALALALPTGRRLVLLGRSLLLSSAVALAGMSIGGLASLYLEQIRHPVTAALRWGIVTLFAVPAYVHALAWSAGLRAAAGWLLPLVGSASPVSGWSISWWVQTMALLPAAFALGWLGWRCVDPTLIEAGRMQQPMAAVFWRVMLPLAAPYLGAGAGLLFVLSLLDYTIPSLFQTNVYALEILAEFSASGRPLRALLIGLPLVTACLAVIGLSLRQIRHVAQQGAWRRPPWAVTPNWPPLLQWAQQLAFLMLGIQLIFLPTMLLNTIGSWQKLASTLGQGRQDLFFTLMIALLTAILALPLALPMARRLLSDERDCIFWWVIIIGALAWPASLVGIGSATLWSRLAPTLIYGRWPIVVLASLGRLLPWAALVLQTHLKRLDPELTEAAALMPVSPLHRRIAVTLPMLAPGLLATAGLVGILTAGELGATLIVIPPGHSTLTLRVYNYLHYGASEDVAGLCLIMWIAVMAIGATVGFGLRDWSRLYSGGTGK